MLSTASQLRLHLHSITDRLADLIRELPVEFFDTNGRSVVIIAPKYYWGKASVEQRNAQLAIKRNYEKWFELFQSVLSGATDHINRQVQKADQGVRQWIELGGNWSLSPDREVNERKLRDDAGKFFQILDILEAEPVNEIILVPDTNSIVSEPDPTQYRKVGGGNSFIFLLLPTVLAELDELKNLHRNPDFREKVKKTISRIKGWRKQGSLNEGITVSQTITVRAIANEPDMQNVPSWLDENNNDDRIIASILKVQSAHPTARVILVTGDINLLNKADAAWIENAEL